MKPLTADPLSFLRDGERVFLISGEQHYFRVPHNGWADRLKKLADSGANCVATYVPWLLHEPREGSFDFHSAHLAVEKWLESCAAQGLWAVVRPGPYQYSELRNAGLPTWLLQNYPQIMARTLDGLPFRTGQYSISYNHPVLLEKTRAWFEQIIPLLARHQTDRGGSVAAVQIDNELMGIHEWFGSWDYHPAAMGIGQPGGAWPEFLRARYGDLPALNDAWGTAYSDWVKASPILPPGDGSLASQRRLKDYNDFYFARCADYMETLGGWMRELGITVPLMHNSGGPGMNAYFEQTLQRMGKDFLFGSDHYYNLGMDWGDGTHPTPKYASKVFYSLAMLSHFGQPPSVLEMPGGSASDWPPIVPEDLTCAYLTNLAYGMKGYNIYVHAGGENPPGAADPTGNMATYDYGAGVAPSGELRPLYFAQKAVAELINRHPWLPEAQRMHDCRIALIREHARSNHYGLDGWEWSVSNHQAWTFMRKGLMMTAFNASLSPIMVDVETDDFLADIKTPLMLATGDSLARSIQERLVRFLDRGGSLLIAPTLPCLDENFRPCTLLADALGFLRGSETPHLWSKPRSAQAVLHNEVTGAPIGWEMRTVSGGGVILLEYQWNLSHRWQERMLSNALTRLGADPIERCDNPNVWTSLLSNGEHSLLFLMNFLTGNFDVSVTWRDPARGTWNQTGKRTIAPVSVIVIEEES